MADAIELHQEARELHVRQHNELISWHAIYRSIPAISSAKDRLMTGRIDDDLSSEWKLPLRGRITYRHCRQPKLPNLLYSSNCLLGGGTADAGNATPNFCFSVPAISKLTTLTVELLWTAPTETAKHHILAIGEAS